MTLHRLLPRQGADLTLKGGGTGFYVVAPDQEHTKIDSVKRAPGYLASIYLLATELLDQTKNNRMSNISACIIILPRSRRVHSSRLMIDSGVEHRWIEYTTTDFYMPRRSRVPCRL